jgi:hypothetical protein
MSINIEIPNLLKAAVYDSCLSKLNIELKAKGIDITPRTITIVIKNTMEIVEASVLQGEEQKKMVEKLVRKVVKDAPITDDKEKLLLDIIDEGVVGDVIDLVISATKGELNVNAVEKAAVGCCLAMLKRRNN